MGARCARREVGDVVASKCFARGRGIDHWLRRAEQRVRRCDRIKAFAITRGVMRMPGIVRFLRCGLRPCCFAHRAAIGDNEPKLHVMRLLYGFVVGVSAVRDAMHERKALHREHNECEGDEGKTTVRVTRKHDTDRVANVSSPISNIFG